MSIKLQGSVAFEPEFVGQLSMIARALLEAGLDPAAFTIAKHGAQADSPEIGAFQYDYTCRPARSSSPSPSRTIRGFSTTC